ncbi:hypothetical protein GCM10020370_16450 [Paenibacillus hodogayensis]
MQSDCKCPLDKEQGSRPVDNRDAQYRFWEEWNDDVSNEINRPVGDRYDPYAVY